ncbi:MAG: hypothetical protein KDE54_29745, partial [Caldilineaceae bacterium]|nr:hypothetical protein [Caldilineaceae bacterium]
MVTYLKFAQLSRNKRHAIVQTLSDVFIRERQVLLLCPLALQNLSVLHIVFAKSRTSFTLLLVVMISIQGLLLPMDWEKARAQSPSMRISQIYGGG